ncbi:zinc transporter ZIP1 [Nilaparvata lugens]|uniref:zinc transporter ZIP1 n=1 Tax=Nilaparvata lugens TaxID=108931 RepID=UPI00193C9C69|nr:zinc transporter ZIP1 [Nilaparvata lugens]
MPTLATFLQPDTSSPPPVLSMMENHTHTHLGGQAELGQAVQAESLIGAKIVAMLALGLLSFLLGMLPVKLASWLRFKTPSTAAGKASGHGASEQPLSISLMLCFGGGVLLFTTFLHLQPEVRESVQRLAAENLLPPVLVSAGLNVPELIFCCGFFFVYIVEELVHCFLDRGEHAQEDEAVLHRTMSLRRCSRRHHEHPAEGTIIPRASLANGHGHPKNNEMTESGSGTGSVCTSASTQGLLRDQISVIDLKTNRSPLDPQVRMTGGPLEDGVQGFKTENPDDELLSKNSEMVSKSFRGLLAILALSFHAVFEGLAVGLEDSVSKVWYLFAAIATHKLVIAFCVGVELVSSRTRLLLVVVYVATFAAVTPLGIGIGIALSGQENASGESLLTVVLQGMAAGTLLYVVFFEVLQRERANTQSGGLQLIAIITGFLVMLGIQVLLGHEHSHGGEGHSHTSGVNYDHNHDAGDDHRYHYHHHDHDHDHAHHT